MKDAKRRLAELKDGFSPDQQGRERAAHELLKEFGQVASDTGYVIEDVPPAGLDVALPNFAFMVRAVAGGGIVTIGSGRQREEVAGLKYDPLEGKFVGESKERTPGIDVLADAIATLFEAEIERRRPKPAPDPFDEEEEEEDR